MLTKSLISAAFFATLSLAGCGSDATTTTTSSTGSDAGADTTSGDSSATDVNATDVSATDVSSDATNTAAPLEILGTWTTPYGDETITASQWTSDLGSMAVVAFDNGKNVVYTQTSADDKYNPNKFNRIVWTEPKDNAFWYCMVVYGKDSLALAEAATESADAGDPDKGGCGGFPWTKMTKK